MNGRTYLDAASVAPPHPAVADVVRRVAPTAWADPSRSHTESRAASDLLSSARSALAAALGGSPQRLAFTSGGTEAIHLAIRGTVAANRRRPPRILSSAVEYSAVLAAADAVAFTSGGAVEHVRIGVDREGRVDPDALEAALSDGGAVLVNVQHANHEVGAVQPLEAVAALCRRHDAFLHVDACQTVGRLPVGVDRLGADLLSVSSAKLGAGPGAGALLWSPRARLRPLLTGDEREGRMRSGTQDLVRIAAMVEVLLQLAPDDPNGAAAAERVRADELRRWLRTRLGAVDDVAVHGPDDPALPNLVAASALYVDAQALTAMLDRAGFAVHSGSSCASTSGEPSHVLVAMQALTQGHVRASFGPEVGRPEIDAFATAFADAVHALRGQQRP